MTFTNIINLISVFNCWVLLYTYMILISCMCFYYFYFFFYLIYYKRNVLIAYFYIHLLLNKYRDIFVYVVIYALLIYLNMGTVHAMERSPEDSDFSSFSGGSLPSSSEGRSKDASSNLFPKRQDVSSNLFPKRKGGFFSHFDWDFHENRYRKECLQNGTYAGFVKKPNGELVCEKGKWLTDTQLIKVMQSWMRQLEFFTTDLSFKGKTSFEVFEILAKHQNNFMSSEAYLSINPHMPLGIKGKITWEILTKHTWRGMDHPYEK